MTSPYVQAVHEAGHYVVALRQTFNVQYIEWNGTDSAVDVVWSHRNLVPERLSFWLAGYAAERLIAQHFGLRLSDDDKFAIQLLKKPVANPSPNWFLSRSDTRPSYEIARVLLADAAPTVRRLADDLSVLPFGTTLHRRSIPWVEIALGLPLPTWND